ncbi:helix-turn-helix transcriptional regulator [Bradyrhizobium sp. AUGA SZCCT0431]|uniref:ArsR/SmtB family transcription factor n=1 Tax=Bradyrhizobium sp. AUGA SZCCT0431 TaxID=2807674 RepID=UPI001BAB8A6F|nr:metalloregulator ArsR/SmtB family transcription factor [Bradyrhizobium sp. AUGA SZCCT0431]MBR1147536.1 helix-turn-helix transcriptional regulator [Bradyrhizobium sp. AUGA SZCCT0431]
MKHLSSRSPREPSCSATRVPPRPFRRGKTKYREEVLDRTFAALADPTRRALVARLGDGESLSASELAQPFAMSLPAIIKHLDVLSDAGLIAREKTGRTVACRLTAKPMEQAMDWLNRYQRFWSDNRPADAAAGDAVAGSRQGPR